MRLFAALFTLSAAAALAAQSVPTTINYQGRLTDNTPQQNPVNATVPMKFVIWNDPAAGTSLWQEPASGGTNVAVVGGIFNVALGGNGVAIPSSVFTGANSIRYLEITVNPGPSQEILAPRQLITASGYANLAQSANSADSALTASTATLASNSAQLGGVAAGGYLLTGGTAANSNQLGGAAATGWQKKLAAPACPIGQSLTTLNQDGTTACAAPAPSGAPDFGYVYLNGSAAGTAIAAGNSIPFTGITGTPPGTAISYTLPNVILNATGTYQVTAGFASRSASNSSFQLVLNGVGQPGMIIDSASEKQLVSNSFIVSVTVVLSTLALVNNGGAALILNNGSTLASGAPCAYLTIVRLR